MANPLQELKRRKVFRVAAVYAVVAWLLIQVADTLFPALQLPDWTVTFVSVLLLFGFLPGVVIAWAYERTSEGVRPDRLVQASPGSVATSAQPVNYLILIVVLIVAGVQIADRFSLAGIRGGGSEGSQSHNASVLRAVLKLEQPLTAVFPDPVSFLELSSDGSTLYFTRNTPDSNQLVMKQLDTGEERAIVDAPGSLFHRISPDGSRILYAVQGGFAISTLDGRSTGQISVRRTSPFGDWLTDDEILFTSVDDTRIHSISISTNTERRLTELDDDYGSDAHPFRLPGGNAFLYVRQSFSRGDEAQVLVYDLRSGTSIPLIEGANSPRYLA
ncbi:MAG: PD40 domain-containing protein, partial [Planctomycetaceae bacterium]|nr:PD40 domain-containing protein [Planctomycetaceae bacterium]